MNVLVACEFSGIVRDAFLAKGHTAVSCDVIPTESPGPHIQDDVLYYLAAGWDLMIAHPPCTYLANSGVRWLYEKEGRWDLMREASKFFRELLYAPIPYIAIENPLMHGFGIKEVGRSYNQKIQPYQFGHPETKGICLWLQGLSPLKPTDVVTTRSPRVHWESPGPDRWKRRSRFYEGIAAAMADQWG